MACPILATFLFSHEQKNNFKKAQCRKNIVLSRIKPLKSMLRYSLVSYETILLMSHGASTKTNYVYVIIYLYIHIYSGYSKNEM